MRQALAEQLLAPRHVEPRCANALVDVLSKAAEDGKIGDKVAMVGVADPFGIELSTAARASFKTAGFDLVYDKTYPLGTQDMQPDAEGRDGEPAPTASWPSAIRPTRFAITEQAQGG